MFLTSNLGLSDKIFYVVIEKYYSVCAMCTDFNDIFLVQSKL